MKKVAIVVIHFADQKLTDGCLSSIEKLNRNNCDPTTIVVNNNPKDNVSSLKAKFPGFIFLETGVNLGFTGGNNFGVKEAFKRKADYFLFVNNDTVLDKDLLVNLVISMEKNPAIGILGPKIYFASGHEFHKDRYKKDERGKVIWYAGGIIDWQNVLLSHRGVDEVDSGQFSESKPTDFVSGCGMMVRREVFAKIGLFDDRYFLYLEDADFCQRAKLAGFKTFFEPRGFLYHINAASSGVGGGLHDYFFSRNRLLFGFRYASLRTKLALAREGLRLLLFGRCWQRLGVADFFLGKFGRGRYSV